MLEELTSCSQTLAFYRPPNARVPFSGSLSSRQWIIYASREKRFLFLGNAPQRKKRVDRVRTLWGISPLQWKDRKWFVTKNFALARMWGTYIFFLFFPPMMLLPYMSEVCILMLLSRVKVRGNWLYVANVKTLEEKAWWKENKRERKKN